MYDGSPALEVGFLIDTAGSFDELAQLQRAMGSTEAKVVSDATSIERATGRMVNLGGGVATVRSFGNAATTEMRSIARETAAAERAGEGMVRQLTRQTETFGKTASEIRIMRAEQRALAAEGKGMTELAGRIRALSAEMSRLEATSMRGAAGVREGGSAMGALAPQAQDAFTQMSMGANIFNVLAIQGGQFAGQMIYAGGALGKFANFMMGPWGLALTGGMLLLGALTKGLWDNADATKAVEVAADNTASAQNVLGQMFDLNTGKIINNTQALRDNIYMQMVAMQQKAIIARTEAEEALSESGAGRTTALGRFWSRAQAYATGNGGVIAFNEQQLAREEGRGRQFQDLGRGVAQGGISREEAGRMIEAQRGKLGDDTYFSLQQFLNKSSEENSATKAVAAMEKALKDGTLDRGMFKPDTPKKDTPKKDTPDRHAESLVREAEATQAQIKNLYGLAEAYKVSGAAALIAEARVKAESDAIKKRGDIEAMVSRQVQLAIAQRVADAAKSTAGMQEQVNAQRAVNDLVAAGQIPAEKAADLVKDQLTDLPLLQAAQAAQQRGLADEAMKAMTALADQQAVRAEMRREEERSRFNLATASGNDRLEDLREELRLVGATNAERNIGLAVLKATREAEKFNPADRQAYIDQQRQIAVAIEDVATAQRGLNREFELMIDTANSAADAISRSFGRIGGAVGDSINVITNFQKRQLDIATRVRDNNLTEAQGQQEYAKLQLQSYTDLAGAAKGLFKEHSAGYKAMAAAEKAFALVQLANTAVNVAAGAAKMFASLGPFAFPAVAAMLGVMAVLGFSKGGSAKGPPETNQGTGTVFGDPGAKSESIKNAIDALREVDTVMLGYSRQMANSLRTIENNIEGFASVLVRNAESINASAGVKTGFNSNATSTLAGIGLVLGGPIGAGIGALLTKIPVVGSILKGLFGTKTSVVGSGLFGGEQSLGSVLSGGYDAQYYSDINKKKKLFGFTTSNKTSTQYTSADPMLENQFTLILREFNNAIVAAAGPLGAATSDIQQRLNGFVFSIGKIDLQGLTGEQIEEKLSAVFGAAADNMARAAFPGIEAFQKAGEGAFETLIRVASTLEAVGASLDMLGQNAQTMSMAVKLGLADQFDSISDLTSAVDSYFSAFYTKEEQAAARTAQMGQVFQSLGMTMPTSLAAFRALVEAQNLNTDAGREAYATLLKLAPAFADLQSAMEGAKSAADIASERADLERQLLELRGDTAALRALQLARLDASNRALQMEIWAIQDAQAAAKAADELRKAWSSVGDSIMDEVRRIRGLTDSLGGNTFAALMGQFNAATSAARGGDMDAAKSLPQLSQALLAAAADAATSRQELDRIRAQAAASLEATYGIIGSLSGSATPSTTSALFSAVANSQPAGAAVNDNSAALNATIADLREETEQMRKDLTAALTTIAANTGKVARTLDNVTPDGDAVSTRAA